MKVRCYCNIYDGAPPLPENIFISTEASANTYGGGLMEVSPGCTRYWFTVDLPVAEAKEKDLGVVVAERER